MLYSELILAHDLDPFQKKKKVTQEKERDGGVLIRETWIRFYE